MPRLATVSYLNARPLIDGVDDETDIELIRRVPSGLLQTLESGDADIALCPVIDFQRSTRELEIVPAGAIGCDGPALTVKLFSRQPLESLDEIAVDGESHTSVALLSIIMRELHGAAPALRPLTAAGDLNSEDAVLLIGDKVIVSPPDPELYPHRLDLGRAWKELTGRPFVFATWMTRAGVELGDLPRRLDRIRRNNRGRLDEIAATHAEAGGWPPDLAASYLGRNLRYRLGTSELEAISEFWSLACRHGIIGDLRPMKLYKGRG